MGIGVWIVILCGQKLVCFECSMARSRIMMDHIAIDTSQHYVKLQVDIVPLLACIHLQFTTKVSNRQA